MPTLNNQLKIKDINIYNFRGLNNLSIENLSTVNIFVGANNSGKTSVLEAIHLLAAPDDIGKLVNCALLRAEVSAEARKKKLVNYLLNIFQKVEEDGGVANVFVVYNLLNPFKGEAFPVRSGKHGVLERLIHWSRVTQSGLIRPSSSSQ